MKVENVIGEIMKDEIFYKNSGGGVTISGGEPLYQASFVKALLSECKKRGIHATLDTTGYARWNVIREIIKLVDLVLFDIKHLDPVIHKRTTGVSNAVILENLKRIADSVAVWLRIPLIAGLNDSVEHILKIADLCGSHNIQKISLLPYHEGGASKCEQMGVPYPLPGASAPADEYLMELKEMLKDRNIQVSIGN
jgi:pyruvate formate lyase activating enzyme